MKGLRRSCTSPLVHPDLCLSMPPRALHLTSTFKVAQGRSQGKPRLPGYQAVVTVIQDLSHVGIKALSPPVELFRFNTPVVPASSPGAVPEDYALGLSRLRSMRSTVGKSSPSGSGTVEFNAEVGRWNFLSVWSLPDSVVVPEGGAVVEGRWLLSLCKESTCGSCFRHTHSVMKTICVSPERAHGHARSARLARRCGSSGTRECNKHTPRGKRFNAMTTHPPPHPGTRGYTCYPYSIGQNECGTCREYSRTVVVHDGLNSCVLQ